MDFQEKLLAAKIFALEESTREYQENIYALEERMEKLFAMKASQGYPQQPRPPQPQVPQFQPQHQEVSKYSTEQVLAAFMKNTEEKFQIQDKKFDECGAILIDVQASIQSLENKVRQLVRENYVPPSCEPSCNIENDPMEHLGAGNPMSGNQIEVGAEENLSVMEVGE
ncbi:hypothetical protein, partial [Bartonella sp. MR168JLCBS]|uniref:hypothetical protein n=1 Tax=Bartonella sp. MR168JLCBS TaxID=3243556 RepID=UPI0035CFE0AE